MTGFIVFEEDFNDGDYNGWQIVDEGNWSGPSDWSAATVCVDGSEVLHAFDNALPGGSLALYCYANEGTHFDNISVSEL